MVDHTRRSQIKRYINLFSFPPPSPEPRVILGPWIAARFWPAFGLPSSKLRVIFFFPFVDFEKKRARGRLTRDMCDISVLRLTKKEPPSRVHGDSGKKGRKRVKYNDSGWLCPTQSYKSPPTTPKPTWPLCRRGSGTIPRRVPAAVGTRFGSGRFRRPRCEDPPRRIIVADRHDNSPTRDMLQLRFGKPVPVPPLPPQYRRFRLDHATSPYSLIRPPSPHHHTAGSIVLLLTRPNPYTPRPVCRRLSSWPNPPTTRSPYTRPIPAIAYPYRPWREYSVRPDGSRSASSLPSFRVRRLSTPVVSSLTRSAANSRLSADILAAARPFLLRTLSVFQVRKRFYFFFSININFVPTDNCVFIWQ